MIRVLIGDDHPLFRSGIRAVLEGESDAEVVGEAGTAEEALSLAEQVRPDVVVMDLHLPVMGGVEATRRIVRSQFAAVLVVSMLEDEVTVRAAVAAGAAGYIVKGAGGPEMLRALHTVADGGSIYGGAVAATIRERMTTSHHGRNRFGLSDRELEVIDLMARGLTNAAIAERVFLSPKTVRNYVSAIFTKLGAGTRAEAVARARDAGFGTPGARRL